MTTATERSDTAAVVKAVSGSYEEWLTRTVDAMPELTEQQQHKLRDLLRP
jgi:hypothetical protein